MPKILRHRNCYISLSLFQCLLTFICLLMKHRYRITEKASYHFTAFLFFLIALCNNVSPAMAQSWNVAGSAGFSGAMTNYNSIAIDANGSPYVVYEDSANAY